MHIKQANEAYRGKHFAAAMAAYLQALHSTPGLRNVLLANMRRTREAFQAQFSQDEPQQVAVCGWSLTHNAAGRVHALARLYQERATVEILGALFPKYGHQLWEPLRDTEISVSSFVVDDPKKFLSQALELVAAHPCQLVHVSKPRMPNIIFGMLYKLLWGARVIVDIDDNELAFVEGGGYGEPDLDLGSLGRLPEIEWLYGSRWTEVAVKLSGLFDAVTVSNPVLQEWHGGTMVRHARSEDDFDPARFDQRELRRRYSLPLDDRVVLFLGTPREHKCLLEAASALEGLGREDVTFLIVGSFGENEQALLAKLQTLDRLKIRFLPNQSFSLAPELVALADICLALQHPASGITEAQVPAKLSDALAMGRLPVVTGSPALADLALDGLVLFTDVSDLPQVLAEALDDRWHAPEQMQRRRDKFLAEFSLKAGRSQLAAVLDGLQDRDERRLDQFMRLVLPHFPGLPDALLDLRPLEPSLPAEAWIAERRLNEILAADCPEGLEDVLELSRLGFQQAAQRLDSHGRRPLVSIIMPTHNRAPVISEAIQSVVEQDYPHWELWVCDDGSTDVTLDVVCQFADARIHYLPLDKGGAAAARNEGLACARGELIAYLDSDNLWRPQFLTRMVCALLDRPGHLSAFGGYLDYRVKQDGKIRVKAFERPRFDHERLLHKNYIDLNSFVHWRELYDSFGGFTASLSRRQDYDLILKYTWLRDPVQVDEIVTLYQRHDCLEQLTVTKKHDQVPAQIIDGNIQRYLAQGLPLPARRAVQRVTVLSWDMSRNHFSKAFAVAEALSSDYDVQLVSFRFFEEEIFPPLKNARPSFETVYLQGGSFPDFFAAMQRALDLIDGDVLYVVKPRLPSLGLALLANAWKKIPLVLEINDLETVVQRPEAGELTQTRILAETDLLEPELLNPYSNLWSQLMEPLARQVPVLLTHNAGIDAYFDHRCLYMRNLKDERIYNPDRYDREAIRTDLGFGPEDRVILFGGLIRRHKGIYELVELMDRLDDQRYKLLFVGSRMSPDQKKLIEEHGDRLTILPPQDRAAMARINLAADLVILWLNPDVPASHYQMPYKATDALAMGTPVIANDISDFSVLADQGYLTLVPFGDWDGMVRQVQGLFAGVSHRDRISKAGRRLFARQFSYPAARAGFELAVRRALAAGTGPLPVAREFAEVFNEFSVLHSANHSEFLLQEDDESSAKSGPGLISVLGDGLSEPWHGLEDAEVAVLIPSASRGQGLQAARRLRVRAGLPLNAFVLPASAEERAAWINRALAELDCSYFVIAGDQVYPGMDWLRIGVQTLEAFGRGLLPLHAGQPPEQPGPFFLIRRAWLRTAGDGELFTSEETGAQTLENLWQRAKSAGQAAWNGDAVVYDLSSVISISAASMSEAQETRFLARSKPTLWRRLFGRPHQDVAPPQTVQSKPHLCDESIFMLNADELKGLDSANGREVAILMPSIHGERSRATARHLLERAGMPADLYILMDRRRQGFIKTVNLAARRLQARYIVYLAEDAVAGQDWLATAFRQLESSAKGLLAFNCGKWRGRVAAFGMARTQWTRSLYGRGVFFPGYLAHRADNELTVIARTSDNFVYCADSLVLENDPAKLVLQTASQIAASADRKLFRERFESGFGGLARPSLLASLRAEYFRT